MKLIFFVILVLLSLSNACFASDLEIRSVSIAIGNMIIVNFDADGGEYGLGATLETKDEGYIDLPPKRITGSMTLELAWKGEDIRTTSMMLINGVLASGESWITS